MVNSSRKRRDQVSMQTVAKVYSVLQCLHMLPEPRTVRILAARSFAWVEMHRWVCWSPARVVSQLSQMEDLGRRATGFHHQPRQQGRYSFRRKSSAVSPAHQAA